MRCVIYATVQFSTIDFNGPIVVTVSAEDWNDNTVAEAITLNDPGSAISSLAATPGNKTISLSWEAVPGATSYTLYYTSDGTAPSPAYGEQIAISGTSYDLNDLKNGQLYIFLLHAQVSAVDYWSDYTEVFPL